MIIKVWNNYDKGVYQINPNIKKIFKKQVGELKEIFSSEEIKELRQIAREFIEELGLVFEHNLVRGWENKLLAAGMVMTEKKKILLTKEEIRQALSSDGQVQFHACRKNGSMAFIKTIKKPKHLQWL